MKPASFLATLLLALLAITHLARLLLRLPIIVDETPIPMETSVVACIVLGLFVVVLLMASLKNQATTPALFLAAPLLGLIAIAHALRLIFRVPVTVAEAPFPMWASLIACTVPVFIVIMLWRELKKNELTGSDQQPDQLQSLFDKLMVPWVDRTIALVAALPFAHVMVEIIKRGELSIPLAVIVINHLVIVTTMVLRTRPVRITPNPWYWLLAFVATYGGLYVPAIARKGVALVPDVVTDSLSLLALAVLLCARLSLGRSIGFVPAQRVIVTQGAYRFVRHPIYTGIFLSFLSWTLRVYSPLSVAVSLIWCTLFVVKSFIEEGFLREDPDYADYLTRVRWRWFHGLD